MHNNIVFKIVFLLLLILIINKNSFAETLINPPVTKFNFKGNISFENSKLKDLTSLGKTTLIKIPKYTEDELKKDLVRVKSFYQSNGFLFVSVEPEKVFGPRKAWIEITFYINEGIRTFISNIHFKGINNFKKYEIEKQIECKQDSFLNPYQINDDKKNISLFYNNHGYIFARVNHELKFNKDKTSAELIFIIEERQLVYVNNINVTGLKLTKEKVVTREIELKEGDILQWQKITLTKKNINSLGIFSDVKFEPINLDESKNRADLLLKVTEKPPYFFSFGFGYGSIDKERILVEWSHENLFGENQRFKISTEFKSKEDLYRISFVNPRIFDTRNELITTSSYRRTIRDEYKVGELTVSSDLRRNLTENIIGSIKYKLQNTDLFDIEETAAQEIQLDDQPYYTQSFIYTLLRNTRDSVFYPKSGSFHKLSYQYAGGILGGDNSFKRYIYSGSWFVNLWKEAVLGYRIYTGFVKEFGDTERVPVEERFLQSGYESVRGYGDEELGPKNGGNVIIVSNLELRFPIYKKIYGVIFYDGGQIYEKEMDEFNQITPKTFRYGRGVGLRYHTIVVPFRFDYAEKIDRQDGEKYGQFYITVGQAF